MEFQGKLLYQCHLFPFFSTYQLITPEIGYQQYLSRLGNIVRMAPGGADNVLLLWEM